MLREASGADFTSYKKSTISRRIARRMTLKKIERLSEYLKHLQAHREELDDLYGDLLIHVTSFFRDPEVFRALRNKIPPQILARKQPGDPIRIWVPGCSTGEEAQHAPVRVEPIVLLQGPTRRYLRQLPARIVGPAAQIPIARPSPSALTFLRGRTQSNGLFVESS